MNVLEFTRNYQLCFSLYLECVNTLIDGMTEAAIPITIIIHCTYMFVIVVYNVQLTRDQYIT